MQQMFINNKAPFYRLARIIRLDYIEQQPLINSLNRRFAQVELNLPEKYSETIVKLTKGHPYYTQLAFQQVLLINILERHLPTERELLNQMLIVEKDYLEKVWEDISRNKEYVYTLRAMTEGSKNIYHRLKPKKINVARAIKKLEGMGLLFKDEEAGYYISDPLLEKWIHRQM